MKNVLPALRLALVAAFGLLAGGAWAGPYDTWGRYKTLTINTTNTGGGANVSSTLTNYPVLVRLTTATAEDILDEALANGADVRFASSDGSTALSYQIERWGTTRADIWVLVPSVTGNSTTNIRIYWNKSGQSDASAASTVFATSNSFAMVWHLNESPSAGANGFSDASGSGNTGTAQAGAATDTVTAVAGKAFVLNGSSKYVSSATSITNSPNTITISAWFKTANAYGSGGKILGFGSAQTGSSSGYDRHLYMGNDGKINWGINKANSGTLVAVTSGSAYNDGNWHFATGRLSSSGMFLYVDGTQVGTDATVTSGQTYASAYWKAGYDNMDFWANAPTSRYLNGSLDEVIVSTTERSADWIKMSYQSQKTGATCVTFGPTTATTFYWHRNSVLVNNGAVHRAYNWTMNADGTGRMAPSVDDDNFTATTRDAEWTCQDADGDVDPYDCNQTDKYDRLWIEGYGDDIWATTNEFIALRRSDITGDFDVSVRLDSVKTTSDAAAKHGLFMADDFTNLGLGGYGGLAVRGDLKLEWLVSTGTAGQLSSISVGGSAITLPVWLRLVKSGTSLSGYYRNSLSSAWTQFSTTQTPTSTASNSQIGLLICAHSGTTQTVGVFDEFQGGGTNSDTNLDLSFAGTGTDADATAYLWYDQSAASVDFTGFTGWFDFDANTLTINSGDATFVSGMSVAAGTGTLAFTGNSGTQVLTPASGLNLPNITHTAASTLQLSTSDLSSQSFSQSAGVLDFNSMDITTTNDFTISSGTTSSLTNLSGRTLTVGGDASLAGQSGNLLNLNAGSWTLTVGGTLTAQYAYLAGSDASGGSQGTATLSSNGGSNSNWYFDIPVTSSNLTRSLLINFNTTSTGANVSGNVTNIPILVRFTSSNLTFSATTDEGVDLLFVDKDGSTLYHEVAEWDKANQTGKVWVKVPQVDGNSTGDYITAKYGCDSCTSNTYASASTVFSGFQGVFHLNAPEEKAYDAATLANHGAYGANLPVASGITGKGATFFDGTANSFVNVPNETNYDITTNLSVWAWIKVTSFSPAWQAIVTKGDDSWRLVRNNSTNNLTFTCEKTAVDYATNGSVNVNDGAWHLVVGTYDGANVKLYVDGVQDGSNTALTGSVTNSASNVYIGENIGATGRNWNGPISEVRIGNAAAVLSADFIKLSYQNQKESSALFSFFSTASFSKSKVFKFNTTASGANVSGNVTDFPLLLRFTDAATVDATRSAGQDIRFLDRDGVTWLPYQIERWDQGSNVGEIWVKVPQVDGNSAGDHITMYYDEVTDNAVSDGQCATCVFATASGSAGAWHLNETGNSSADGYQDATGNAAHAQGANFSGGNEVSAMIARGQTFASASSRKITVKAAAESYFDITSAITVSAWINVTSWTVAWQAIVTKGEGTWRLARNNTNGTLNFACNGLTTNTNISGSTTLTTGGSTWYHAVGVYDGGYLRMYLNGASDATALTATGSISTSASNVLIGENEGSTGRYFNGVMDEVRVENVARSADWIKLAYETQRASPTLFNSAASDFRSTRKYRFNTTPTGADVTADVTSFPMLVRITGSSIVDSVQDDYEDIRFLDADGRTWLNYVVERWSKAQDSAEVWVLVPQVDGNSDQDFITLYYNDSTNNAVPNGQCGSCVFGTATGFTGVWHMNDNAASATVAETVTPNNGTFKSTATNENTSNHDGDGQVGGGLNFEGGAAGSGGGTQLNNFTHALQWPKATGTVSHWVKPDQVRTMVSLYESNGTSANWNGFTLAGTDQLECHLGINGTAYSFDYQDGTNAITQITGGSPGAGTWAHVAATWDRSGTSYLYVNGVQVSSDPMDEETWTSKTPTVMQVGRVGDGSDTRHWDGLIDEIQVSSVQRSADWIKLAFATQRLSSNLFWNNRPGPDNQAVLTATPGSAGIALTWTTPVTDSANADSIGIWVKYSGSPQSVGAAGQTKVVVLPVTDSAYTYPATYTMTYYFALAVRDVDGEWSPFTAASTDTVLQTVSTTLTDTIYVDSAIGSASNTCTQAQNPSTPKLTLEDADGCDAGTVTDTLVIRVMPGTYSGANNDQFDSNVKPIIVTSFDPNSRAVFVGSSTSVVYSSVTYWPTVYLWGGAHLRNVDLLAGKTSVTTAVGVMTADEGLSTIEGCRIYNNGSTKHDYGIFLTGNSDNFHVASNVVVQPNTYGIWADKANDFNIVNNTVIGTGAGNSRGITMTQAASTADMTIANNILYNWDYGIHTTSTTAAIGVVSNNLFHLVTSNREMTGSTDAAKVSRDPLFYNTTQSDRHAYKLLPGSPAIDAGTSSAGSGYARTVITDLWGTARPQGSARDIGAYEGSGYTPNPAGEFDTLTNTTSGNTVIVKNTKFKLVWDMARGGGITGFYNMSGDSTANLVGTGSLLFDVRLDTYLASTQTSNSIAPSFQERTRARSVIRQRLALSASLDLNVYYTVYPSGHVYVQSEITNLGSGTLDLDVVQYGLKVGAADAVAKSAGSSAISDRSGYGYLNLPTRDAFLSATTKLDGDSVFSETWSQTASVAGSLDSVTFQTSDLADPGTNMSRHHHFLIYVGDLALDQQKAATLNADAFAPSPVSLSAGSLLHGSSWQDELAGHWPLDEGTGATAKDVSLANSNNTSSLTSVTWVSGKVNGALRFTTSSVAVVNDHAALEARRNFSVSFWVKPDFSAMGSTAYVLSKGQSGSDGWSFRRNSGVSTFRFLVDGASADSPVLTTGVWHHIAGVVGGSGQLWLYVNGVLVSASTTNATMTSNANALRFGEDAAGTANDAFAGDLDDVRIYSMGLTVAQVQALCNRGFASKHGHYHLRADNNNRVVALLNEGAAATRVQPAFEIDNWYGTKTPKYVYLNGVRLAPNVDYAVDSVVYGGVGAFGSNLYLQLNQVLTGADQTLFVDDNDSSGYLGEAAKMKDLTIAATASDKIAIQNFSGTTFGSAASGQWAVELDLNGWITPTVNQMNDIGFGEFNSWKAAAISPNVAVSSATELTGNDAESGRNLSHMKFDDVGSNEIYSSGEGYLAPTNITYTLTDSSATRFSLLLTDISLSGAGTATLKKRFTVYPSGRIYSSFELSSTTIAMDQPRIDLSGRYSSSAVEIWGETYAQNNARYGMMAGDLNFHSFAAALLSIKSSGTTTSTPGTMIDNATDALVQSDATNSYSRNRFCLATSLFEATDDPITINYVMDISRDFADSATADSLMKDIQTPAAITAITGTANPADALDFNGTPDGFAEGDGAYVYTSSSGIVHFKFVNTVAHFSPAFRIKSWSVASLPEYVTVDNQTLVKDYHFNAYVNTASDELIMQFNKTFQPGTHVFYISHKTGLAVTLNRFEAVPGEGVDSLKWSTESEFENLGFNVWRRVAPVQPPSGSETVAYTDVSATPGVNGRLLAARVRPVAKTAGESPADTLPSHAYTLEELQALGYVRLNAKLISGAPGGSSASTREYHFVDRAAAIGKAYEYLLEAVDFHDAKVQYGPRTATPGNPLETALLPNYPNPFNPVTTLRFSLKEQGKVSLLIFDARGRLVRQLIRPAKPLPPGKYRLLWDARDEGGFEVPSGQYFYRFSTGRFSKTRKMLLVK